MNSSPSCWEQGSEFHLIEYVRENDGNASPWNDAALFFGSGRDALRAVLSSGMATKGWKRLLVPAYFCQTVVRSLLGTGMEVRSYASWYPGDKDQRRVVMAYENDVVLIVNHFGLQPEVMIETVGPGGVTVIEDHTHDPWSASAFNSRADYCIVSLRKTLPIPDGGVLWSPTQRDLPLQPTLSKEHRVAAGEKLQAMVWKNAYLQGQSSDKTGFRSLFMSGEKHLCGSEVSAISDWTAEHLVAFPILAWRKAREKNHEAFAEALSGISWVHVITPSCSSRAVPFSCVLLFDSAERREIVRRKLIHVNIFPTILWPLERPAISGIGENHIAASRRMLSIHCDMRYSTQEMVRVADMLTRFGNEYRTV
jgi:hypothetical protein